MPDASEQCIFCLIKDKKVPSLPIYEDDFVIAVLDKLPATKGHAILIPKKHVNGIHELSDEEVSQVFNACKRIIFAMTQILNCEGVNLVYCFGPAAGQRSPHMLIYIIPRYKDDQVSIIWNPMQLNEAELKEAYESLKKALLSAALPEVHEKPKEPEVIEEKPKETEVIEEKPRVPSY